MLSHHNVWVTTHDSKPLVRAAASRIAHVDNNDNTGLPKTTMKMEVTSSYFRVRILAVLCSNHISE
jgi:hypothetical protein